MLNEETLNKIEEIIKFVDGINFPETKSGRKYAKISKEEFVEKLKIGVDEIESYDQTDLDQIFYECFMYHWGEGKCSKDLKKINFDSENCDAELLEHDDLVYLKCRVGGDWEYPITCFLYFDGKDIRGYVPSKGNTFNILADSAFGSEYHDSDYVTKTMQKIDEFFVDADEDFKTGLVQMLALYKMGEGDIFSNLEITYRTIIDYVQNFSCSEVLEKYEDINLSTNDFLKRLGKI